MIIWAHLAPELLYQNFVVPAPHLMADDVGSLLLRAGLVAPEQLAAARQEVRNVGGTVPEQLVQQGHIDDEALTAFYRKRLLIPRINPSDLAKLSARLLEKVPADMATEFRSIPVSLDREGNLTLVMSDPSDTEAVDEIGFFTGSYVVRAIATQAQIAWCLAHYYKQKTKLYLGLVAEGRWPETDEIEPADSQLATQEMPRLQAEDDGETGPMKVRTPKRPGRESSVNKRAMGRAETEDDPESQTRPHKVIRLERPNNQQPSPPELFARAGEIRTHPAQADHPVTDEGPAVVISMTTESGGVVQHIETTPDTAPILLTDIRKRNSQEEGDAPIVLDRVKRKKRRTSKRTYVGVGAIAGDSVPARSHVRASARSADTGPGKSPPARDRGAPPVAKKNSSKASVSAVKQIQARSVDLVGGDWGAPGTTIPPGYLGAVSGYNEDENEDEDANAAVPVAIADEGGDTSRIRAPDLSTPLSTDPESDQTIRSDRPDAVKVTAATDAATNLLIAVRKIDRSSDRGEIVESILDFLDLAYERTGFLAVRQDDLISWRLHNCPDGASSTICVSTDSTFKDSVRTRLPYNGPLEDSLTKQLAGDLDIPDALDLLLLPIALRERVVGAFFALSSYGPINEDHINVLTQAASEGFERIVLSRKL